MESSKNLKNSGPQQTSQSDWKMKDLLAGEWNKTYKIDGNTPLSFKMMDNSIMTKEIQKSLKASDESYANFQKQLGFIDRQKQTKLWVKIDGNIINMTLLDVYNTFLAYLKDKSYEDQLFNVNEVSFLGPLGPFTSIPLVQCINYRIINQFIYSSILTNKIPMRKMRILTEGKVLVTYGQNLDQVTELNVKQITDTGILFSSHDEYAIDDFGKCEILKFHVNTDAIKKFTDNKFRSEQKIEDLYYSEDDLRYFFIEEKQIQRSLSYRSDETNEFFLFCRYHDMLESDVPNVFSEFMEKLEDYFKYLSAA